MAMFGLGNLIPTGTKLPVEVISRADIDWAWLRFLHRPMVVQVGGSTRPPPTHECTGHVL